MAEPALLVRTRVIHVALLLAFCLGLYFWRLDAIPFYTRGEPREGLVVWEMAQTGNWVLPRINDDYIPFKPPLFHWFAVAAAKLYGDVNEFTTRLPSALFATLGVFLVYFAGARFWSKRAGLAAGLVLVTRPEWWSAGTQTQVDMTLAFFLSAALVLFWLKYEQNRYGAWTSAVVAALVALATLAKGPIGCAFAALVMLAFLAVRRDLAVLKKAHIPIAIVVFIMVAGSWYAGALSQGGWAFFKRQILEENLGTAEGTFGHPQAYWYFVPIFLANLAPWSLFLPSLGYFLWTRRRKLAADHLLFPLIWLVTIFAFCTLSTGKRGVYILPLYPAAALLIGAWWSKLEEENMSARRLISATAWLLGAFTVVASALLVSVLAAKEHSIIALPKKLGVILELARFPDDIVRWALWISLGLVGGAGLLALASAARSNWRQLFIALTVIAAAVIIFLKFSLYPATAAEHTLKPFAERVARRVAPQAPLLFYRTFDFGAVFYSRRHIPNYAQKATALKGPFYLLMSEQDWLRLRGVNHLKALDISEGDGPTGRRHLVLVEPPADPANPSKIPPLIDPEGYLELKPRQAHSASE